MEEEKEQLIKEVMRAAMTLISLYDPDMSTDEIKIRMKRAGDDLIRTSEGKDGDHEFYLWE